MVTTSDLPMTVRVYSQNAAALLCEFPYFVSLSVLDSVNNVGSFNWVWNLNSPGASNLISDTGLQIAVMMDARDGNGFQEVWRGLYEQDNYDPSMNLSAQVTAQGRSMLALLDQGIVYPAGGVGSKTTSVSFTGASPGNIMHTLITSAQARGCFPSLGMSFTSGQDSSGAAWTKAVTNAYSAGTSLMQLVVSMAQSGLCDISMTGSTLNMYNAGTTLATDRSASVFLRRSRDVLTMPASRDRTQISTVMLGIGDQGFNVERTASTYGTLGRYEKSLSQSGVVDAPTMNLLLDQALGAVDDQKISYVPTYTVDTKNGGPIPWKSYHAGDYISIDIGGSPVKYRASQFAVQCGPGGPTIVQPTLNDVFYDRAVILQNQMNAVNGGVITGVASPGIPAPGPNPTVPNAPAFQTASIYTAAYYSPATGTTLAQMELQWTTPTNTDGTTMIDGANYIVQYRLSTTPLYPIAWSQLQGKAWSAIQGNPWSNPLATPQNTQWTTIQVPIDNNNLIVQGLICGETYQFQIACTDVSGNTGLFSSVSSFLAAADNVAPVAPDAPIVSASMVSVQVFSDLGSSTGGTFNLAQDLDHLEVHYSYDPTFTPIPGVGSSTYLGKLIANAGMLNAQIPAVGTFHVTSTINIYIKLIAVDVSGNTSPPSPGSPVTATLIDDSHISSLSVSKLIAGTVTATIILGGSIGTALSGQRVQMDSTGLHAYDASGNLYFDLNNTSTTMILSQADGGPKITLDTIGLYPTIRLYDAVGTNNAFINATNSDGNTACLGINSGSYTIGASTYSGRLFMQGQTLGISLEVIDATNGSVNGGLVQLLPTAAVFGVFVEGATHGGQLVFNYDGTHSDSNWELDGYLPNFPVAVPQQATYAANLGNGMGTAGSSWLYGATMYSTMIPNAIYACSVTSSIPSQTVSAATVTGGSVTLSAGAPGAWSVFLWAYRVR